MKRIFFLLLFAGPLLAVAQSVGISNTAITPASSSILELRSATQGLLIPRMLSTQRTAIAAPATGLIVFQTDAPAGFYYFDGTDWKQIGAPALPVMVNFRYYAATGQVTNASANTKVDFGALSFLNNAQYSNSIFTATAAGIYRFDTKLNIFGSNAGKMSISFAVNGVFYSGNSFIITAGSFQTIELSDDIQLAAGDAVYVYVTPTVNEAVSVGQGTSFSGYKIN